MSIEIEMKATAIIERKAYEKKCIEANICPDCGGKLNTQIWSDFVYDVVCTSTKCVQGYHTSRKYILFGPLETHPISKVWDTIV